MNEKKVFELQYPGDYEIEKLAKEIEEWLKEERFTSGQYLIVEIAE